MTVSDKSSSTASAEEPRRGRLFVVAGPSGVGKGTVIRGAYGRWPFYLSVSATTRSPRPGEVDGVDYIFVSEDTFDAWLADERFLEWNEHFGRRYGTPRHAVEEQLDGGIDVVLEIDVEGARQVRERAPQAILVFIEPPSLDSLRQRLINRGDTADIDERLARAERELAMAAGYDHRIVNDVLADAVARLLSVLADPEGSHDDHTAD